VVGSARGEETAAPQAGGNWAADADGLTGLSDRAAVDGLTVVDPQAPPRSDAIMATARRRNGTTKLGAGRIAASMARAVGEVDGEPPVGGRLVGPEVWTRATR
jgi:hypothetical protein